MWASPDYYRTHGYYFGTPKALSTPKMFGINLLKRKETLRGGQKRR